MMVALMHSNRHGNTQKGRQKPAVQQETTDDGTIIKIVFWFVLQDPKQKLCYNFLCWICLKRHTLNVSPSNIIFLGMA